METANMITGHTVSSFVKLEDSSLIILEGERGGWSGKPWLNKFEHILIIPFNTRYEHCSTSKSYSTSQLTTTS